MDKSSPTRLATRSPISPIRINEFKIFKHLDWLPQAIRKHPENNVGVSNCIRQHVSRCPANLGVLAAKSLMLLRRFVLVERVFAKDTLVILATTIKRATPCRLVGYYCSAASPRNRNFKCLFMSAASADTLMTQILCSPCDDQTKPPTFPPFLLTKKHAFSLTT